MLISYLCLIDPLIVLSITDLWRLPFYSKTSLLVESWEYWWHHYAFHNHLFTLYLLHSNTLATQHREVKSEFTRKDLKNMLCFIATLMLSNNRQVLCFINNDPEQISGRCPRERLRPEGCLSSETLGTALGGREVAQEAAEGGNRDGAHT